MENCYTGITIPGRVVEPCNGEYKSTDCFLSPIAFTYLDLPVNASQTEINNAVQASLLAKEELINEIDGSETKVTAGSNITVTGTGTFASPFVISGAEADGSETKLIAGDNISVTGIGTDADPYIVEAIVPAAVDSRPYKSYTARMTQNGSNAPTFQAYENGLMGMITWTWESTGLISLVLPLDHNNRAVAFTSGYGGYGVQGRYTYSWQTYGLRGMNLTIRNELGNYTNLDGYLWIEIRVYN